MKPRILIVEDIVDQLDDLERYLQQIPEAKRRHYGIEGFTIHKATTGDEARMLLSEAAHCSTPYDLMLLDLSLPQNKMEKINKIEDAKVGHEILLFANQNMVRGAIVVSVFSEYKHVVRAFREGAADFVAKPYTREELQTQVLSYFEKEGKRILTKRIETLIPYAERDLASRFRIRFNGFVRSVSHEVEGLKEGFEVRWGLDVARDSTDPLVRNLIALEDVARVAQKEWSEVFKGDGERAAPIPLGKLLDKIKDFLLPSLTLKNVKLEVVPSANPHVLTFQDDVRMVLTEIILGGVSRINDHDEDDDRNYKKIEVSVRVRKERVAEVIFVDNLPGIPKDGARLINEGGSLAADHDFGRTWGLAIAQHVALRGGGRLKIEPLDGGNRITYSIPLANNE